MYMGVLKQENNNLLIQTGTINKKLYDDIYPKKIDIDQIDK